ncbi:helix-turn-helix domain-containing protein [Nocardia gipuzkoensis]|uniref:helix-turn-helix domain-containing protein n=2 Tax=Nocardia gipuzkoensis TaxID=2749991 RepID=UPI003EE08CCD
MAMNWLHTWLPADHMPEGWSPGVAPQIASAVWPLFLLLSVEALSRVRWRDGLLWALARYGGVGTVAAGSAVISYGHVHDVLTSWGYDMWAAAVGPLVIDGLVVACGFAMLSESGIHDTDKPDTTPAAPVPATAPARDTSSAPSGTDATVSDTDAPARDRDAPEHARDAPEHARAVTSRDSESELDRDERIRRMHLAGKSTRQIGLAVGVSHTTVARIVARNDDGDSSRDRSDSTPDLALTTTPANGKATLS